MNIHLKNLIDGFRAMFENGSFADDEELNAVQFSYEIMDFISYLCLSDGTITDRETEFLKECLDVDLTPEEISIYMKVKGTSSVPFEQMVPKTLIELAKIETTASNVEGEEYSFAKLYVLLFEAIGKEFIACDGNLNEKEIEDYSNYIGMLHKYINENDRSQHPVKKMADAAVLSGVCADKKTESTKESEKEDEPDLNALLDELNSLVGLDAVKKDVSSLIHLQEVRCMRKERGMKDVPMSNHLVFYGNPGTGKTTVARILAKIYRCIGILSKGHLIEVDRSGLVAGYVGQTAIKVQEVVQKALGGVLFIDEAYALSQFSNGNDYGIEAIDTLLKAMEDNRDDFIVIVAGYTDLMEAFINSNPGLRSRFNKFIKFEDYSPAELLEIFKTMCEKGGYKASPEALEYAAHVFEYKYISRDRSFANAREVRNFFEDSLVRQADRLYGIKDPTDEELITLELSDVTLPPGSSFN